jgi:hypothetical protein
MIKETAEKTEAEKWLEVGNEHFLRTDYPKAIDFYSRSLTANCTVTVLDKRAQAHLLLQKYGGFRFHKKVKSFLSSLIKANEQN